MALRTPASEIGATIADLEDADRAAEYQDAYFADLDARPPPPWRGPPRVPSRARAAMAEQRRSGAQGIRLA